METNWDPPLPPGSGLAGKSNILLPSLHLPYKPGGPRRGCSLWSDAGGVAGLPDPSSGSADRDMDLANHSQQIYHISQTSSFQYIHYLNLHMADYANKLNLSSKSNQLASFRSEHE